MEHDLTGLLQRLTGAEVDFVLVGGFAAVAHGCSIVTRDVDVAIALDEENLSKLWRALKGANPVFRGSDPPRPFTEADAGMGVWKNLYLRTDLGGLDCLGEVKGIGDYEECASRSTVWNLEGSLIRILDRESLVASKIAMGRDHDLQTVAQLRILSDLERD